MPQQLPQPFRNFKAQRWTEQKGNAVKWGNMIGHLCGQSGTFTFKSPEDARRFAKYAGDGFPSLADSDLKAAGVPLPVDRS